MPWIIACTAIGITGVGVMALVGGTIGVGVKTMAVGVSEGGMGVSVGGIVGTGDAVSEAAVV